MVDQETIVLADGTRQEIPPCIHTSPENNTQVSRGYKLFSLFSIRFFVHILYFIVFHILLFFFCFVILIFAVQREEIT